MLDPPPTATITSAPDFLQASIPSVTFFIVGFGFTSEYTSKGIPAFSKTSVTLLITPHSANDLSVTTNAFLNPLPDAVLCSLRRESESSFHALQRHPAERELQLSLFTSFCH